MDTTTQSTASTHSPTDTAHLWVTVVVVAWASVATILLFPSPTVVGTVLGFLAIATLFGGFGALFGLGLTSNESHSPSQLASRRFLVAALPLLLVGLLWAIDVWCLTKPECSVKEEPLGVTSAWMGGAFLVSMPFVVSGVWVLLSARGKAGSA